MIPLCPQMPEDLVQPLRRFAATWLASPLRPRVDPDVTTAWCALIDAWIQTPSLPLYIRKSSVKRGVEITHSSGRRLIPCDNTTAVWAYTLALEGRTPTLEEVAAAVRQSEIPFTFTGLRGRFAEFYKAGWKLAHVDEVGLGTRQPLQNLPISMLEAHFRKLVLPSNMFAVPKRWAGLGEVPEIIDAFRSVASEGTVLRERATELGNEVCAPDADVVRITRDLQAATGAETPPAARYESTRLLFKAAVIEPLADDDIFHIVTPQGTFAMTKRTFRTDFRNVAESASYRAGGTYSYSTTPQRALQYLLARAP